MLQDPAARHSVFNITFFRRALNKKSIYSRHSFHVKSTTYAMVCDACFEMQRSAQTAFCKRARKVGGGDGDGRVGRGCSHERSCLATFCRPRAINSSQAHTPVADTQRAQTPMKIHPKKMAVPNNANWFESLNIASRLILTLHVVLSAARAFTH